MASTNVIIKQEGCKIYYIDELFDVFPIGWQESTYVEPFLGTGAVYFNLPTQPRGGCILNDHNELIYDTLRVFSDEVLIEELVCELDNTILHRKIVFNNEQLPLVPRVSRFLISRVLKLGAAGTGVNFSTSVKNNYLKIVEDLKMDYYIRLKNETIIDCNNVFVFLKKCITRSEYKSFFVYCDPPYVHAKGNIESNKSFTENDLDKLINTLESMPNTKWLVSCRENSKEFYEERGYKLHFLSKVKSVYSLPNSQNECFICNYEPIRTQKEFKF